ncbi:MAG TPA: hypothetical protein PK573_12050 [Spirochaetota bacterium]|nr:hypothetical protein [Spirochaetota bacterium]
MNKSGTTRAAQSGRIILNDAGMVDTRHPVNAKFLREALAGASIRAAPVIASIKAELNQNL